MEKVIAFDVSSANVGYSVFEYDDVKINLIDYGVIKPIKTDKGSIIFRLFALKKEINKLLLQHNPTNVAIEEIISFMKGKSTARTIITLASFNRMIGLAAMEFLNKEPKMLNVLTIRSKLKIDGKAPKKEQIPEAIEKYLQIKFPWIMKKNKKTKLPEINIQSYDLADAIACGYSFIIVGRKK